LILKIGSWFWGKFGLCIKLMTPSFDPMTDSFSSTPVWVRLPKLRLHLWGFPSLRAIINSLGKFHYKSEETKNYSTTTYARICVEMDFNKGFPTEIIMTGETLSGLKS
jgi:hypothetical protein